MTRADLEPREVGLAVDVCQDTLDALSDGTTCDDLRALYLP